MNTFICHDKRGDDRKAFMDEQINRLGIVNTQYVTDYDADTLTEERLARNAGWESYPKMTIYSATGNHTGSVAKEITNGDLSLIKKHEYAWKQCVGSGEPVMVFEDDVELPGCFNEYYSCILQEWREDLQFLKLIMLCGELGMYPRNLRPGKLLHYASNQRTRNAFAYIIHSEAAAMLLDGFKKVHHAVDIWMNIPIQNNSIPVGWTWPCLSARMGFKSFLYKGRAISC